MKTGFTTKEFGNILLFVFMSALLLSACSSGETVKSTESSVSDKTFIFKDGSDTYRVEFEGDKIKSIYKNNQRIPDSETDNYKDLVNYELKNLTRDSYSDKQKSNRIKIFIDKDRAGKDSSYSEEEEFDLPPFSFKFKFDDDFMKDFKVELDSLMKELKDKDFEIYINPDDMKSDMYRFKKFFRKIPPPEIPKSDIKKYKEGLKKYIEQMKKLDSIDIDLRDMYKDLKKKSKRNIEIIELKKNAAEHKKSKFFINELKEELIKDGYLESLDSDLHFRMNDDKINVNGKDLPLELVDKYKDIFRKHYNRDFDEEILIEIN